MTTITHYTKGTFQMLWDCPQCGSKGLLGVDHRHCPTCGQAQAAHLRYFPRSGQAIRTNIPSASDWMCEHCSTPNRNNDIHCVNCGAPKSTVLAPRRASIPEGARDSGHQAAVEWEARQAEKRRSQEAHARRGVRVSFSERNAPSAPSAPSVLLPSAPGEIDLDAPLLPPLPEEPANAVMEDFRPRDWPKILITLTGILVVILGITCAVWKEPVEVTVTGHSWKRTVEMERFTAVQDGSWCDSKPHAAYNVSSYSRTRSYREVPDGEECSTIPAVAPVCSDSCRNVDRGNGSFSVDCTKTCTSGSPARTECHTKYRSVPVEDWWCDYTINRFVSTSPLVAEERNSEPKWPSILGLDMCLGEPSLGCLRMGDRGESYTILLTSKGPPKNFYNCKFPEKKWKLLLDGSQHKSTVRVMTGGFQCDDLK